MPKPLRYFFIVLALLGLAFAIWTGIPRRPRTAEQGAVPEAAEPGRRGESERMPEFTDPAVERSETPTGRDAPAVTGEGSSHVAESAPERAPAELARLKVRFVDALGRPWPEVKLESIYPPSGVFVSDAEGRLDVGVPRPWSELTWQAEFVARKEGCAAKVVRCTLTVGAATSLGDVLLEPGVNVYGRTVDERGRGIAAHVGTAKPELTLSDETRLRRQGGSEFNSTLAVQSAADGSFLIPGVPPGEWRLWAKTELSRYGWTEPFVLVEGREAHGLEIVVPAMQADDVITGIVLTPDGLPVPHASLSYSFATEGMSSSSSEQTGADGRFRIVVEFDGVPYDLIASDPGKRFSDACERGVRPGTRDLELRLGANQPIYVFVRGPRGEPVDECQITLNRQVNEGHWSGSTERYKSNGEGRYELLVATGRWRIDIEAEGYRKHHSEEFEPLPGSTLDVRLERPELLRGRVLAEGKPAAGAKVLRLKDAGDTTLHVNGFRSRHRAWPEAQAIAADDGSFELPYEDDQPIWVRAELPGFAPADAGPLRPSSSRGLELRLVRGGAIEGVVIPLPGEKAEGVVVGISRGDGFARTQRAGADGRFRFEGLTPGPWQVLRRDEELNPNSSSSSMSSRSTPIEWSCEVTDGRTTRFDLDLSRP